MKVSLICIRSSKCHCSIIVPKYFVWHHIPFAKEGAILGGHAGLCRNPPIARSTEQFPAIYHLFPRLRKRRNSELHSSSYRFSIPGCILPATNFFPNSNPRKVRTHPDVSMQQLARRRITHEITVLARRIKKMRDESASRFARTKSRHEFRPTLDTLKAHRADVGNCELGHSLFKERRAQSNVLRPCCWIVPRRTVLKCLCDFQHKGAFRQLQFSRQLQDSVRQLPGASQVPLIAIDGTLRQQCLSMQNSAGSPLFKRRNAKCIEAY